MDKNQINKLVDSFVAISSKTIKFNNPNGDFFVASLADISYVKVNYLSRDKTVCVTIGLKSGLSETFGIAAINWYEDVKTVCKEIERRIYSAVFNEW